MLAPRKVPPDSRCRFCSPLALCLSAWWLLELHPIIATLSPGKIKAARKPHDRTNIIYAWYCVVFLFALAGEELVLVWHFSVTRGGNGFSNRLVA